MNKNIAIITTGGTIDKQYVPNIGQLEIKESAYERMFATKFSLNSLNYPVTSCFKKDSLEITNTEREQLLQLINNKKEKYILITHGTDTINKTAEYLDGKTNKVIVLTGAMVPYGFPNSDAEFNIGFALGCIGFLKIGTYIAMSGLILPHKEIYKDKTIGHFKKV